MVARLSPPSPELFKQGPLLVGRGRLGHLLLEDEYKLEQVVLALAVFKKRFEGVIEE